MGPPPVPAPPGAPLVVGSEPPVPSPPVAPPAVGSEPPGPPPAVESEPEGSDPTVALPKAHPVVRSPSATINDVPCAMAAATQRPCPGDDARNPSNHDRSRCGQETYGSVG